MLDTVDAFIEIFDLPGAANGPLGGLKAGIKDLYDIAGHVTGYGSPDWARTHDKPRQTATAVQALLDAGARVVGKTHTDEIAYSLMGVNAHFGTPVNTAAPDRVPGGSSSGSVAATAAGLIDVGLGSDTGGSVRIPASFCGVYGLRTTHGRLSLQGARPLAPSYDTVGWFARSADVLQRVGLAFGMSPPSGLPELRFVLATDAFGRATPETRDALVPVLDDLRAETIAWTEVDLSGGQIDRWRQTFQILQAAEVWEQHGAWVQSTRPSFGPGIRERFEMASRITSGQRTDASRERAHIKARVEDILGDDGLIVLPSSPGPAPLRDATNAELDVFRTAALEMLCIAGHAGLPQISLPLACVDGAPVGLSIIAPAGRDEWLLRFAQHLDGRR